MNDRQRGTKIVWGLLVALALGGSTIVFDREAHVASQVVTLADVADLSALPAPLLDRARNVKVAMFADADHRLTLNTQRVSERARAQIPALAAWLPNEDNAIIVVERRPAASPSQPTAPRERACLRLTAPLEVGGLPRESDFATAPCDETAISNAFRYDRGARVLRARRLLEAGALVYAPPATLLAGMLAGEPLSLAIRVGPVAVERDATVAAPARPGERVFVRTSDNQVFAVPYPERAP